MESSTPNQPPPRAQRRGGFTLIELLLVTVILGLLASITAPYFGAAKEAFRETIDALHASVDRMAGMAGREF